MQKIYLSATDMMKYLYCPRIVYYIYVLKSPQYITKKETKGIEKYEDFKDKSKRNKIIKEFPKLKRLYDVFLVSEKHNLITKADCILFDDAKNEAFPVSIKYSKTPRTIYQTQRYQLFMEALLIEEQFKKTVPFGFIKFLLSGDVIKINTENKNNVLDIFRQISDLIKSENFPKATEYRKRCVDCCYKIKCWQN